jgi:hypothetical protein
MKRLYCAFCHKPLSHNTEIEYSGELTEFYCDPSCATSAYFDYMRSVPVNIENKGIVEVEKHILYIDNDGKIFKKDNNIFVSKTK